MTEKKSRVRARPTATTGRSTRAGAESGHALRQMAYFRVVEETLNAISQPLTPLRDA